MSKNKVVAPVTTIEVELVAPAVVVVPAKKRETKQDAKLKMLAQIRAELAAGATLDSLNAKIESMVTEVESETTQDKTDRAAEETKVNAILKQESDRAGLTADLESKKILDAEYRTANKVLFDSIQSKQAAVLAIAVPQIPEGLVKGSTIQHSGKCELAYDGIAMIETSNELRFIAAVKAPRNPAKGEDRASNGYKPDESLVSSDDPARAKALVAFKGAWELKTNKLRGFTQDEIGVIGHANGFAKTRGHADVSLNGKPRTSFGVEELIDWGLVKA